MGITSRGKHWEIMNSLWIGFTFSLGFFTWISFLYVGIRVSHRRWIIWGLVYAIPGFFVPFDLTTVAAALTLPFGIVGLIHAFKIRPEYLVRLEAKQRAKHKQLHELKHQLEHQPSWTMEKAIPQGITTGSRHPEESPGMLDHSNINVNPVNINQATEQQLAELPGVGIILAKRAIELRQGRGQFTSIEDFGGCLGLKPHIIERLRPMVEATMNQIQNSELPKSDASGRVVDY